MSYPHLIWVVVLALFVAASPTPAQQGPDDLWEITSKMEMAGMPFAMPPQTSRVCLQKGKQEEGVMPKDQNCRIEDMRRSGNRTTFRMICEGKDRMTGTVDITSTGDSYQGTMQMQGTMDGRTVNMTNAYSGRKVGSCTWVDVGAQQRATVAAQCRQAVEKLEWFAFKDDQAYCKEYRNEFVGRVRQVANEMRDPVKFDGYLRARSDMQQVLMSGGQDPNAIWADACQNAGSTRNWGFVANYCEAQAKEIAVQQCTGRRGTSVQVFEYAPICTRYPQARATSPGGGQPQAAPPAPSPAQAAPGKAVSPTPAAPGGPTQAPGQAPVAAPQAPTAAGAPAAPTSPSPTGVLDKALETINPFKGLFGK